MERRVYRLLASAVAVFGVGLSSTLAGEPAAPSADAIHRWVAQLGSDDYGAREVATVRLMRAGRQAINAVAEAAMKDDLEVAWRSVEVLQALLSSEDLATGDAAADALGKIAEFANGSSADLAADVLVEFQDARQSRAIEEIRRLGGIVGIGNPRSGNADGIMVTIGEKWQGRSADLKLLKRIPDLELISVHGVGITDSDLKQLEGLPRLSRVELYGAKVSAAGLNWLSQAYPGVDIDRRSSAMLGVACQSDTKAICQVTKVQPDSAAERGGLLVDDIIVKFQDQPVPNFETLTALIAARNPGDKVTIEIRRGNELLKKEVELGAWK